jgi:hypothetical protein
MLSLNNNSSNMHYEVALSPIYTDSMSMESMRCPQMLRLCLCYHELTLVLRVPTVCQTDHEDEDLQLGA